MEFVDEFRQGIDLVLFDFDKFQATAGGGIRTSLVETNHNRLFDLYPGFTRLRWKHEFDIFQHITDLKRQIVSVPLYVTDHRDERSTYADVDDVLAAFGLTVDEFDHGALGRLEPEEFSTLIAIDQVGEWHAELVLVNLSTGCGK